MTLRMKEIELTCGTREEYDVMRLKGRGCGRREMYMYVRCYGRGRREEYEEWKEQRTMKDVFEGERSTTSGIAYL